MSDSCGSKQCGDGAACGGCGEDPQAARLRETLAGIRHTILVMSGKGGVGKSTVAANMAVSLAFSGQRVGLLDIDFHGPSIPILLGLTRDVAGGEGDRLVPVEVGDLKVMSLGFLVKEPDAAIIWRGPMKMGAIQQLIGDVAWGPLDYLIIDSPPGTGDEPLSVCQSIPDITGAVIVTTPQRVAVADVRRSIQFCRQLEMPVLGVIENMSGFACPHCGEATPVFATGGGEAMARGMGVPFLGKIPMDPTVAQAGDEGKAYVHHYAKTATAAAMESAIQPILALSETTDEETCEPEKEGETAMRYAVPLAEGKLALHFGHCQQFAILDVNPAEKAIAKREDLTPPPHEPGVLPKWLGGMGVTHIIAGGMGQRAQGLFAQNGIEVTVGAPAEAPEDLVSKHLAGQLASGENVCDH